MGRRALSPEEKKQRAQERSQKRHFQQLQQRQIEYQEDHLQYSTVRLVNKTNDIPFGLTTIQTIPPNLQANPPCVYEFPTSEESSSRNEQEDDSGIVRRGPDTTISLAVSTSSSATARAAEAVTSPSWILKPPPLSQTHRQTSVRDMDWTSILPVPSFPCSSNPGRLSLGDQNLPGVLFPQRTYSDSLPTFTQRHILEVDPSQGSQCKPAVSAISGFIFALRSQGVPSTDFFDNCGRMYDQVFRRFFSTTCDCPNVNENNEPVHTQSIQEITQHLQSFLPPFSEVFGERGSYNPSDYFHQWRSFLSDQPSRPLSFQKSQASLLQSHISVARQWDIDSIWLGAEGLQAIRPPNDFRLSFLPSPTLNLPSDQVIQPHGLKLAKTRHILLGVFNTQCVRFSVFLFFPDAPCDSNLNTSTIKNALSLERQKDFYDQIIIPAAYETLTGATLQEMPRTYEIAYTKSRSYQEKPSSGRWRAEDESRSFHLRYTIPAQNLTLFWQSIVRKANSATISTRSGDTVAYFKNPRLLFQCHDLKNTFGHESLQGTLNLFQEIVLQALDPEHLQIRSCWLDIGFRDHAVDPSSPASLGSELYTLLWKSQCHHRLHERLSQASPGSALNASHFQGFLLRDVGDYQCKTATNGTANSCLPKQAQPGIIRFKAYNCIKEQVSVMFSSYNLFGSGSLPLLALSEEMMKDLSSTREGNQAVPVTQINRTSLLKAWEANKRHVRAISDAKTSASYSLRKEMTFRLDTILVMWDHGYFDPKINPHVGRLLRNVSLEPGAREHYPFWVVLTSDINSLIFTQAARFIVPLDHLFQQASLGSNHSSPYLIIAFYTALMLCRLLINCLNAERHMSYDDWIWLSRWTIQNRLANRRSMKLERRGIGIEKSLELSGIPWIPQDSMDWYGGRLALKTLVHLYLPRSPLHASFIHQTNIQSFTANRVSVEYCLEQLVKKARIEFDRGHNRAGGELVEDVIRLAVEEISRAYHINMLSKMQTCWSRVRLDDGHNSPPTIHRLQQSQTEATAQISHIVTAQTIWEIYEEAWSVYTNSRPDSEPEGLPKELPCWKTTRKFLPPKDGWSEFLYRKCKGLWEMISGYAGTFDARFRGRIGNYILVIFNSDQSKEIGMNCISGSWYKLQPTFFRIQFWAPYFTPPKSNMGRSWGSIENDRCLNPHLPAASTSSAIHDDEFHSQGDDFQRLWAQFVLRRDNLY
ncbi:hypothetical protein BGZ63DRAFT_429483 [Mariannaea sp. PMI_226]|nr:hypothetical protein BGZ63DRAFT_429483 [Mariannaea sp. PMI_226]